MLIVVITFVGIVFLGAAAYGVIAGVKQGRADLREEREKAEAKRKRGEAVKDDIRALLEEKRALSLPGLSGSIGDEPTHDLLESRIGGQPAWPEGRPYPKAKGKFPLVFLAQINLGDVPKIEGFPDNGLLQFYVAADDLYGMGSVDLEQPDIAVIWHTSLEAMQPWAMFTSEEDTYRLDVPFAFENWWETSYPLIFEDEARSIPPTFDDYRLYDRFWGIYNRIPDKAYIDPYVERWKKDEARDVVLGGNPFFSQADPREQEHLRKYSHCLLSLDSVNGKLLWGDCGTGSFLITREDLEKRNFRAAILNYDCL